MAERYSDKNSELGSRLAAILASAGAYSLDLAVSVSSLADLAGCPVGMAMEALKSPVIVDGGVVLPNRCAWPIEPSTRVFIERTESGVRVWLGFMADLNVAAMTHMERLAGLLDVERPAAQETPAKDYANAD